MATSTPRSFKSTRIAFWLSLLGCLVAVGLYVYLLESIKAAGQKAAALEAETTALALKESQVGELKKTLAANKAREPKLVSYFIDANDIVPFLETIEGYGKTAGVTVKFNSVEIKKSPAQLAVSVTAIGGFPAVYRFISLVEAAPYEFSVMSSYVQLSMSPVAETGKGPAPILWESNMTLSVSSITGVPNEPAK